MGFLSGILVQILEWFLQKLIDLGLKKVKEIEQDHEIEHKAEDDKKAIQGAVTDADKTKAIDDSIKHIFG